MLLPKNFRRNSLFDLGPPELHNEGDERVARYCQAVEQGHKTVLLKEKEEFREYLKDLGFIRLRADKADIIRPALPTYPYYSGDEVFVLEMDGEEERRIVVSDYSCRYYQKNTDGRYGNQIHVYNPIDIKKTIERDMKKILLMRLYNKLLARMIIEQERVQDEFLLDRRKVKEGEKWYEPVFTIGQYEYIKVEKPSMFWRPDKAFLSPQWSPFSSYINHLGEKVHLYRKKSVRLITQRKSN